MVPRGAARCSVVNIDRTPWTRGFWPQPDSLQHFGRGGNMTASLNLDNDLCHFRVCKKVMRLMNVSRAATVWIHPLWGSSWPPPSRCPSLPSGCRCGTCSASKLHLLGATYEAQLWKAHDCTLNSSAPPWLTSFFWGPIWKCHICVLLEGNCIPRCLWAPLVWLL